MLATRHGHKRAKRLLFMASDRVCNRCLWHGAEKLKKVPFVPLNDLSCGRVAAFFRPSKGEVLNELPPRTSSARRILLTVDCRSAGCWTSCCPIREVNDAVFRLALSVLAVPAAQV